MQNMLQMLPRMLQRIDSASQRCVQCNVMTAALHSLLVCASLTDRNAATLRWRHHERWCHYEHT